LIPAKTAVRSESSQQACEIQLRRKAMPAIMTKTATMKAVRIHSFGGPEVLSLEEVPTPEPKPDEVLVRVHAAGVNPADWKFREGLLGKIPLPAIMGSDFSGEIEVLGSGVKDFRVGESVFGVVAEESGGYAEYAVAPAYQVIEKPASLSHLEAAGLPIASLTAWQALFDVVRLEPGQKVLIHAAAGGVGSFAVQFAKCKGAYVIGTTSAQHAAFVRQLGADETIDYRATRFEDVVREVDAVVDTIGGDTQTRSWKVLKRGGVLVSTVQPPPQEAAAAHGVRGEFLICKHKRKDELAEIAGLVTKGQIKVFIAATLPLREARKAQELSQSGHTQGKIVLQVAGL
jgi:NADPH:quinone reductase-like Zn-dependent oxidoreductase